MKNPFERFSARKIRIIITVISLFALVLCTYNFLRVMFFEVTSNDQCGWRDISGRAGHLLISDVLPGGVADNAGIRNGDTLIAINGKSFSTGGSAQKILNQLSLGDYASYTILRDGQQLNIQVRILKLFDVSSLSSFLLGFGFLFVGYIVAMTRPQGKIQRMFGWYGICAVLYFSMAATAPLFSEQPVLLGIAYSIALIIGHVFGPPIFVIFFLHFPVRRKVLDRKWLRPVLYGSAIVSSCLVLVQGISPTLQRLMFLFPIFCFVEGLIEFTKNYYRYVEPSRRPQLRSIVIASALTVAAITYIAIVLFVNPFLLFLKPWFILPISLIVGLPLAFGYSIFRYRLMDIDLIIKRSLIYGSIITTVAAVYVMIVFGLGQLVGIFVRQADNRTLNIVAFVIIAFIFDPVKRRAERWIDRVFYRERYNYQRVLMEFSRELPSQMNLEEILESMISAITSTMHVEKMAVVVSDRTDGCIAVAKNIPQSLTAFGNEESGLMSLLQRTHRPLPLTLIDDEPDRVPVNETNRRMILQSGIVLAVPMFMKDRLIGTINVGPKLSGKTYSQEDIDLLLTVAGQAAIAIDNARLHVTELEKKRLEEELAIAREIQQGLLPKSNPDLHELDITGISIPALSVGGDYYDFIRLGEKRLLVVVADVSGKGMSAALYMSKIQGMIQLASHLYDSPREMLVEVNRRIYDGIERNSFITMILGMFDLEKKEVVLCRAGHNKALICTDGQIHSVEAGGIGLGLEPGTKFEISLEEVRMPLAHGNLFVFYSDGLTEAMNDRDELFGEDAVRDLVMMTRNRPVADIQQSLLQNVDKFRGIAEVHDDITLVIAKVR